MRALLIVALAAAAFHLSGGAHAAEAPSTFSAEQVRALLRDKVRRDARAHGVVVGVVDENGTRIFAEGVACGPASQPVTADTVFEIGSLTKPFTSALLAEAIRRGEVTDETPVSSLLPNGVTMARFEDGPAVTLRHLADHTAGLPRMPDDLTDASDYPAEQLYAFLGRRRPSRAPGAAREYSNIGYGVLGHVLALRAGLPYEALFQTRLGRPLGLGRTFITVPKDARGLACGHDEALRPLPASRLAETLAPSGAFRSSANDMLRFLQASIGLIDGPRPTWGRIQDVRGLPLVLHDGSTAGFSSYMAYDPARRRGVVLLSNSRHLLSDVALHLLQPAYPLVPRRTAVEQPTAVLDRITGSYRMDAESPVEVSRYGKRLFLKRAGQPVRELFAEGGDRFFLEDARPVTLSGDTIKIFQRDGVALTGKRSGPVSKHFQEVDAAGLDALVGVYAFDGGDTLTVRRSGDRMLAQMKGQDALEIFPLSPTRFVYLDVEAELSFENDAQGRPALVSLLQGGRTTPARRRSP